MGFKDDYQGYQQSFKHVQDRKQLHAIEAGRADNKELMRSILKENRAFLEKGLKKIQQGQSETARSVVESTRRSSQEVIKELGYLSQGLERKIDDLTGSVDSAAAEITGSIEKAARYLGAELSHIRFQLHMQTEIGMETLRTLKHSLDNQSRQYFEQGVSAFGQNELEIARDRFGLALESNKINAVAYQYVGFIAVEDGDAEAAIRNFDLSRKFAGDKQLKAMACYHLANCYRAVNKLEKACSCMDEAVEVHGGVAWVWYEHAKICALQDDEPSCGASLVRAFPRDWDYWGYSICDPVFDCVPEAAAKARENTKMQVIARFDKARADMNALCERILSLPSREMLPSEFAGYDRIFQDATDEGNLYKYLQAIKTSRQISLAALESLRSTLTREITASEKKIGQLGAGLKNNQWRMEEQKRKAASDYQQTIAADDDRIKRSKANILTRTWGVLFGVLALTFLVVMILLWGFSKDTTTTKVIATILVVLGAAGLGFVLFWIGTYVGVAIGEIGARAQKKGKWRERQRAILEKNQTELAQHEKQMGDDNDARIRAEKTRCETLLRDCAMVDKELEAFTR